MMYQKLVKEEKTSDVTIRHYEGYIQGFSINAALAKQAEQLEWYSKGLTLENRSILKARIAEKTNIPEGINRDEDMPVRLINRYVPRGGDIEYEYYKLKG